MLPVGKVSKPQSFSAVDSASPAGAMIYGCIGHEEPAKLNSQFASHSSIGLRSGMSYLLLGNMLPSCLLIQVKRSHFRIRQSKDSHYCLAVSTLCAFSPSLLPSQMRLLATSLFSPESANTATCHAPAEHSQPF